MTAMAEDHATMAAYISGVDKVAREAEAKWGIDRLPLLVDDEMRAKFERQRAKWRFSLETAYEAHVITRDMLDAVISTSGGMQRAWSALDAAATAAGHGQVSPDVWEVKLKDGRVAAIVRTVPEACLLNQQGRYLVVYTLNEVANVIDALPDAISQAKVQFPGAIIQQPKHDRTWVRHGDDIPF